MAVATSALGRQPKSARRPNPDRPPHEPSAALQNFRDAPDREFVALGLQPDRMDARRGCAGPGDLEDLDLITQYGWSDLLAQAFAPQARAGHIPGRVVVQHRDGYVVATDEGELRAKASGRLLHEAEAGGYPAVGDWVALALNPEDGAATIQAILPRRTAFVRRAADSERAVQVIAANGKSVV